MGNLLPFARTRPLTAAHISSVLTPLLGPSDARRVDSTNVRHVCMQQNEGKRCAMNATFLVQFTTARKAMRNRELKSPAESAATQLVMPIEMSNPTRGNKNKR